MSKIRVYSSDLLAFCVEVFVSVGLSEGDAAVVAETLVWASERGHESHGVARVPEYLERIRQGALNPIAKPRLRGSLAATFIVDGDRAAGPVGMMFGLAHSLQIANRFGVGVGVISNVSHLGAIGRYAAWAAECGYITVVMAAGIPFMAYHGATVASLGTSPIAIGIPGRDGAPLLLDMATSVIAAGRIRQAAQEGAVLPEGAALDEFGVPTTDPAKARTVLPLGGAKGSGLALMFECLSGLLAGTPVLASVASQRPLQNAFLLSIKPESFRPKEEYAADLAALVAYVKGLPTREGISELLLPGERGARKAAESKEMGVQIREAAWQELKHIAGNLGIDPPPAI